MHLPQQRQVQCHRAQPQLEDAPPSVLVLLAAHNGERWIGDQLDSILTQQNVRVSVLVCDDASTDRTREEVAKRAATSDVRLVRASERLGSANRNFLGLIASDCAGEYDYFALSDQDDIWLPGKLERAIWFLTHRDAEAYSSNATAFWADGSKTKTLIKSRPQTKYDYLFESAGPGCTFVFRRAAFLKIARWVANNFASLSELKVHDWTLYAFARETGLRWHIDEKSLLLYRQHSLNAIGANVGCNAAAVRVRQIVSGEYLRDVVQLATAVQHNSWIPAALQRLNLIDRLRLACAAHLFRRRRHESFALAALLLISRRPVSPHPGGDMTP